MKETGKMFVKVPMHIGITHSVRGCLKEMTPFQICAYHPFFVAVVFWDASLKLTVLHRRLSPVISMNYDITFIILQANTLCCKKIHIDISYFVRTWNSLKIDIKQFEEYPFLRYFRIKHIGWVERLGRSFFQLMVTTWWVTDCSSLKLVIKG